MSVIAEDLDSRCLFARGWLNAHDPEAALREVGPVFDHAPPHAEALEIAATCWSRLRQHGRAAEAFRRLTTVQPEHLPAWLGLAAARIENGELVEPEVRHAVKRLIGIRPLLPAEASTLALLELQAGQYQAGLALIETFEEIGGVSGPLIRLKATVTRALGDRELAIGMLRRWCAAEPGDAAGWSQLAEFLRDAGRFAAAVEAAGKAAARAPDDAGIRFRLGQCRWDAGDRAAAAQDLRRVIELDPSDPFGAAHHIAIAEGRVPPGLSIDTLRVGFDEFAGYYDTKMVDRLRYRGPEEIAACLEAEAAAALPPPWDILDLGCGTGLVGVALRGRKRRLVGIDLSAKMLDLARRRGLYDALHQGDLIELLGGLRAEPFDVAAAGELFIYFGALVPAFTAIRGVLRPGGYLVFNTQTPTAETVEIEPCRSKTFAHSEIYLRRAAAESGFVIRRAAPCFIRMEDGKPVDSLVTVLRAS